VPRPVVALLEELPGSVPALSTHGDVIAELVGWNRPCKKGSIWVLEVDGREIRPETYLPPASTAGSRSSRPSRAPSRSPAFPTSSGTWRSDWISARIAAPAGRARARQASRS
jgi:hypothetical protein